MLAGDFFCRLLFLGDFFFEREPLLGGQLTLCGLPLLRFVLKFNETARLGNRFILGEILLAHEARGQFALAQLILQILGDARARTFGAGPGQIFLRIGNQRLVALRGLAPCRRIFFFG